MMSAHLAFECLLLSRMKEPYRSSVVRANDLTERDVAALATASEVGYPEVLRCSLETYRRALGEEIPTLVEADGLHTHAFQLVLWPHMCWLVHVDADGRTAGMEFGLRGEPRLPVLPEAIKPGEWTLGAIKPIADELELIDGWDEHVLMRAVFDGKAFDGEFVFGLLQSWRPCAN